MVGSPDSPAVAPEDLASFELTPAQRAVAILPFASKQVVRAGPGTGKTHVVAARLTHLVLHQRLKPHSQILLLSYTRTAVREMRDRLARTAAILKARSLRTVNIRTMDSFAYGIHDAAGEAPPVGGYQETMESALRLLRESPQAQEAISELRHVIVDEAQDLFGVRDQFIRGLLAGCGGGFTVFADPNQAIYDYLALEEGVPSGTGFDAFYRWLIEEQHAITGEIRGSKRHKGEVKRMVELAEGHLSNVGLDWQAKWDTLVGLLKETGTVKRANLEDTLRDLSGKTAILTRTNGEALMVSEYLHDLNRPMRHHLAGPASPYQIPGWIGRVLPALPSSFSQQDFEGVWDAEVGELAEWFPGVGAAFDALCAISKPGPTGTLSRKDLEDAVRQPYRIPPEISLETAQDQQLIVSTVHRAKGREFDNVLLSEPAQQPADSDGQLPMEVKVLYVAMSRPKSVLSLIHFGGGATTLDDGSGNERRWYVRAWNRGMPAKIEIRPNDIDPYSTIQGANSAGTQELVWAMSGCDGLQARRNRFNRSRWELCTETEKGPREFVAGFSLGFTPAIQAVCSKVWGSPGAAKSLTNVCVEGVATFAGTPPPGAVGHLDPTTVKRGYWLVPVVRGLAALWSVEKGDQA